MQMCSVKRSRSKYAMPANSMYATAQYNSITVTACTRYEGPTISVASHTHSHHNHIVVAIVIIIVYSRAVKGRTGSLAFVMLGQH